MNHRKNARRRPNADNHIIPRAKFPFGQEPTRVHERGSIRVSVFPDKSRLYEFPDKGFLIITPQGVPIFKADRSVFREYLKNGKLPLATGGNSTVSLVTTKERPLVIKEHVSGIQAITQMEHMKQIREKLLKAGSVHEVPEYYAVGQPPQGSQRWVPVRSLAATGIVRDVSVMQYISAQKVQLVKEALEKENTQEALEKARKLESEYQAFVRRLEKMRLPLTDVHQGNILTYFNPIRKRFIFVVIDQ